MKAPSFSIGIEEEYQTIDPQTYDLRSHIQTEIFEEGKRSARVCAGTSPKPISICATSGVR
jgi:hypothetical protein